MPNCPKCEKPLTYVDQKRVSVGFMGAQVDIYVCPHCGTILNFPVDEHEIARIVVAMLKRTR